MIVFGIDCNSFIVVHIRLKTCRSNGFVFFIGQNVRKIGRVSEVQNARAQFVQA